MMNRNFYSLKWAIVSCTLFSFCLFESQAQRVENVRFENLNIKDGVSQSTIYSVLQDRLGYIWLATGDGIDRYDGYHIKQYANFANDTSSIAPGWVYDLYQNDAGKLICSTVRGYTSVLDPQTGKFQNFTNQALKDFTKSSKINSDDFMKIEYGYGSVRTQFQFPNSDLLWMGSKGLGLQFLNLKTGVQKAFGPQKYISSGTLQDQNIVEIKPFGKNKLLIGTGNGIKIFDIQKGSYVFEGLRSTDPKNQLTITDIEKIGPNRYWLASSKGIFQLDVNGNQYTIVAKVFPQLDLSTTRIPSIAFNPKTNELWAAANNKGIFAFNVSTGTWRELKNTDSNFPLDRIVYTQVTIDKSNTIWIGTSVNGVLAYDEGKNKFGLYRKFQTRNIGLEFSSTWGAAIDRKKDLWIGDYTPNQKRISHVDRKTNKMEFYSIKSELTDSPTFVFSVDNQNNVFINAGTPSGRILLQKSTASKSFVPVPVLHQDSSFVKFMKYNSGHFYLTRSGDFIVAGQPVKWISDAKGQLKLADFQPKNVKFPDSTGVFVRDFQTDETYCLAAQNVWNWNEKTGVFTKLNTKKLQIFGIQANMIYSFAVVDHRYVYFATYGKGIYIFDLKTNTDRYLDTRDGLPTNAFYEMVKDKNGMLWASSNFGIVRINPKNNQFRTFTPSDGVQGFEFNAASFGRSDDGEIIFGGTEGVNVFHPEAILDNSVPPTILIQSLKSNQRFIPIEAIKSEERMDISSSENSLSFEYLALNFRNASQNQYAYQLEGYDKDWVQAGTRRFTNYTNLPEGHYVFRVKGSNNDGVWNEQGASFAFDVLPPWYRSWWAYLIYIVAAGYSIRYFVKYRERLQRRKMEDRRKNSELKAAQDLQKSMLPKEMPKRKDLHIHTFIRASTEVGGDYYDFFEQEDGRLFIVCGDATGHGTTSGMMVSITKAGLNGIDPKAPNKILEQLNKVVKKVDLGVLRMSLNIVQFDENQIHLASAAMPPMYLYKAATKIVEEIQQINLPLGGLKNETFDLITRDFEVGDVLVQLSDGIPEAPNLAGDMFDYEALHMLIQEHAEKSVEELNRIIIETVDVWLEGQHNPDDITLLITKKI